MDHRIRAAIAGFHGATSLYAKNLDSGVTFGIRENEKVRTASTIKLAIMATVFDSIAKGRAKWTDKLTLRDSDKVGGTGIIREFADGTRLNIRDLVHVMIVLSDNTATNLILDKFPAESVNTFMDSLGLPNTRAMRKVLIDGKPPSGFSAAGRLEENKRFGLGSTTPHEMVTLIEKMERGELVSPTASREMIAILKRQQWRNGIARRTGDLPVANKTGSLNLMRSDVGIVYSHGGRIAIAITVDDLPKVDYSVDNAGDIFISDVTGMLLEGLARTP
ncbi:MAG TPA: serine hydrolase [Bryobacteraceae bacterium]|nr:serine hydrolase [Bryobacteraceae bacterium]